MTEHIFVTKFCQQLLLKRLSKGKIAKDLSFDQIKKKYTHIIVDPKGNILLVKETKGGALKKFLSTFYFAKVRIREPKLTKSKSFKLMRKAQRKFWPGKSKLKKLRNNLKKK